MEGWDPYVELGVDVNASVGEVKAAFREKARQCHPDKVRGGPPDDGDAFRRARRAYELLTEPEARARYDAGMMVDERRAATVVEVDLGVMLLCCQASVPVCKRLKPTCLPVCLGRGFREQMIWISRMRRKRTPTHVDARARTSSRATN